MRLNTVQVDDLAGSTQVRDQIDCLPNNQIQMRIRTRVRVIEQPHLDVIFGFDPVRTLLRPDPAQRHHRVHLHG
jgi:hypothetical protein